MRSIIILICTVLFLAFSSVSADAQTSVQHELNKRSLTLSEARNLARQAGINPNDPQELRRFAKANGVPDSQINQWLEEMGMDNSTGKNKSEAGVQDLTASSVSQDEIIETPAITAPIPVVYEQPQPVLVPTDEGLKYYGYDVFSNVPDAFQPSKVGPVDEGYLIGPGDKMRLTAWGATEFQFELEVDAEGRIFIPNIGQFTVAGQSLKDLRKRMKIRLSEAYSGLVKAPPTIFMDLTLTRLQPLRIFVLGEVKNPGGYTFSSYSSLFNVLYGVGGPTTNGSLRDIRLIRNGKVISTFDLYSFLMEGVDADDIRIRNNDRIFIPKRKNEIRLKGPVRRPAIFELKEGEGLPELLKYAGGLKPDAYGKRFHVERIIPLNERKEPSVARKVIDFDLKKVLDGEMAYTPEDGDNITIRTISGRVKNIVYIEGAVYQPGPYEVNDSVRTVRDLILAADNLQDDAVSYKADLIRTNEDETQTFLAINIEKALAGDPANNLPLQRLDRLKVYARSELENNYSVRLSGSIENPQEYRWRDSLTVYDLLFKGKGLFDPEGREKIYLKRADLIRRTKDGRSTNVIPFDLKVALEDEGYGKELLQPFDNIHIYPNTVELLTNKFVYIDGEVKKPGSYALNDNMTLEDLLIQAGGFTESSYLNKVEVTRLVSNEEKLETKAVRFFWPLLGDIDNGTFYNPSLADTLFSLSEKYNLKHRDRIYIRKNPYFETQKTVQINGEVLFPGKYTLLNERETYYELLQRAGGYTSVAYPEGGRFTRDGELVFSELEDITSIRDEDNLQLFPGDTITIPKNPNSVLVTGNVGLEGRIKYQPGERLTYYLERAGGMQKDSYKYVQLTQASGMEYQVRRKGLFKPNPKVDAGAKITVIYEEPEPKGEKFNTSEFLQTSIATLTSALTIIILIDRAL